MSASAPVPKDDPLMKAWEVYKESDAYANARRWAVHAEAFNNNGVVTLMFPHVDGSLWSLFTAGYYAHGIYADAAAVVESTEREQGIDVADA
jgi:hypothetical protein